MNQTNSPRLSHYVLLRADNLRLLIPQADISATEHLESLPIASGMPGILAVPGKEDACFIVLSDTFQLLDSCPGNRYVTTKFIADDGMEMSWCWTEIRVFTDFALQLHDVPEVLLHSSSPLRQYVIMADQPVFLCSAQILQHLVLGAGI